MSARIASPPDVLPGALQALATWREDHLTLFVIPTHPHTIVVCRPQIATNNAVLASVANMVGYDVNASALIRCILLPSDVISHRELYFATDRWSFIHNVQGLLPFIQQLACIQNPDETHTTTLYGKMRRFCLTHRVVVNHRNQLAFLQSEVTLVAHDYRS